MRKKQVEGHYIVLWIIVVAMFALIIISFFVFNVGQGRWQCEEYEQLERMTINNCSWDNESGITWCNTKLTIINGSCVREVWTRTKWATMQQKAKVR
jgi:hypothetical protein